ncbi:UNVERIFIED_CONTAM: hypothetical protein NCL1_31796 [Trichonephila clavipes]
MKKVVCRWVPHNLTKHQKEEHVRISKETLKLLYDGDHRIISKIVTGDKTYVLFFDILTRQESKVRVFKDDPTNNGEKIMNNEKSNVRCFLLKYGIGQSHQVGRTEYSNSKLVYH